MDSITATSNRKSPPNTNKENEGLSQECIEWDEGSDIDLRQLARSPQVPPMTPALLASQQNPALSATRSTEGRPPKRPCVEKSSSSKRSVAKRLDRKYSPNKEIDGLMELLVNDTTTNGSNCSEDPSDAPTQPSSNLVRASSYPPSSIMPGKGRRRKRKDATDKPLDRTSIQGARAGRRRPRSADGSRMEPPIESRGDTVDDSNLEDLLKQLDSDGDRKSRSSPRRQPRDTKLRGHPKVNHNGGSIRSSSRATATGGAGAPNRDSLLQQGQLRQRKTCDRSAINRVPKEAQNNNSYPPVKFGGLQRPALLGLSPVASLNNGPTSQYISGVKNADGPTTTENAVPTNVQASQEATRGSQPAAVKTPLGPSKSEENQEAKIGTKPVTSSSSTSPSEFGDDIQFSEADFMAIDACLTQAAASRPAREAADEKENNVSNQPNISDIKLDAAAKAPTPDCLGVTEEFDDFPVADLDFDALDRKIADRRKGISSAPKASVSAVPDTNHIMTERKDDNWPGEELDDFPVLDFDAIDKLVAERMPGTIGSVPTTSCIVPPADAVVRNRTAEKGFDPECGYIAFSRYKVVRVENDTLTYTKMVLVKTWEPSMKKENIYSIHRSSSLDHSISRFTVEQESDSVDGCIALRGEWFHTHLEGGDIVHLASLSGRYRTDSGALPVILHTNPPSGSDANDDLVLIVHPDMLIAPTIISETVGCSRRAVLRSRLGSTGLTAKAPLFGTMRHELFGQCMLRQDFGTDFARQATHRIVRQSAESLVGCGISDSEATNEVLRVVPQIRRFAADLTSFRVDMPVWKQLKIHPPGGVEKPVGSTLHGHGIQPDIKFLAHSVECTEEAVVCPELGLKGNIDVTVDATVRFLPSSSLRNGSAVELGPRRALMSIELKTGHNQNPQSAHMAQLALYALMLRVRHGNVSTQRVGSEQETKGAIDSGMLLYLNHESYRALHVSPILNEIKSLIGQRNMVAVELRRASRPRGISLTYENGDECGVGQGARRKEEDVFVEILSAPPAQLPDVLATSHACTRCYANRDCMMYAAAETNESSRAALTKSHGQLLSHFTGHLLEDDLAYFREWDRLIDLEADASAHLITKSWLMNSEDQEKATGKCVSSLVFDDIASVAGDEPSELHPEGFIVLRRSLDSVISTPLTRLNIEVGSHVIVSTDGTSLDLSSHQKKMQRGSSCGRRIFRHQMNIVRGILETAEDSRVIVRTSLEEFHQMKRLVQRLSGDIEAPPLFRLDKDDVATGIGTLRQNLINLFTKDVEPIGHKPVQPPMSGSECTTQQSRECREKIPWLRDMIIRLRRPASHMNLTKSMFGANSDMAANVTASSNRDFFTLAAEFSELNPDQRNAVKMVFCAKDYSLIQGLPGTGKTSTIAFVARLLAAHGKRVLITSYTHAAVDNLMMKLIEKGMASTSNASPLPRVVRVGRKSACHRNVHPILISTVAGAVEASQDSEADHTLPSADSLNTVISAARIVGVTALTVPRSPLLLRQHFDVVIIDEAGQISQPAILGALMAADSFVLVGDHMQLPPLVISEAAEKAGYGVSMLKRLADKHPDAVVPLALQYRMHGDICQVCNDIVYSGKLKCANEEVRNRLLSLPSFPVALSQAKQKWLARMLDPTKPVVFANTDSMRGASMNQSNLDKNLTFDKPQIDGNEAIFGLERTLGRRGNGEVVNDVEALLVNLVVDSLVKCGLCPAEIGVICPFRSQLRLLNQSSSIEHFKASGLEVSTIDRYQGRDKPVVILSFVRSNANGRAGKLLGDFRRLNVAISRAKQKLIMFGSYSTLHRGSDILRPALEKMCERGQIQTLPTDALNAVS